MHAHKGSRIGGIQQGLGRGETPCASLGFKWRTLYIKSLLCSNTDDRHHDPWKVHFSCFITIPPSVDHLLSNSTDPGGGGVCNTTSWNILYFLENPISYFWTWSKGWLGFPDLWSGQKPWWNWYLTPMVKPNPLSLPPHWGPWDLFRSFKVCSHAREKEWDAESNGQLPHLFIPSKSAT